MTHLPVEQVADGLLLHARVTPKAASNAVEGLVEHGGRTYLKVRVTSAPEDGKANDAVIATLGKAAHIPTSQLRLIKGAKARLKSILVAEAYADAVYKLLARLS